MKKIYFWFAIFIITKFFDSNSENLSLFVSLGSTSCVSSYLSQLGICHRSPFTYVLSTDSNGVVRLLENDFNFFLDKSYLHQDLNFNGITYRVINKYYNIDFRHDWDDLDDDFNLYLPSIREKYHNIINSFNNLSNYKGKVYFIRMAFPRGWLNPNYFGSTLFNDSHTINYSQAEALRNVLERKFPDLDFTLLIFNYLEDVFIDVIKLNKVIEFKIRKDNELEDFAKICTKLKD